MHDVNLLFPLSFDDYKPVNVFKLTPQHTLYIIKGEQIWPGWDKNCLGFNVCHPIKMTPWE